MDTINVNTFLPFAVYFTAVLLGLWTARGFVYPLTAWILPSRLRQNPIRRKLQLTLWLSLGALFAAPFIDLLGALESIFSLLNRAGEWNSVGLTPQPYYTLLMLLVLIGIYGFVLWVGRQVLQLRGGQHQISPLLGRPEKLMLLLVPGSLLYRLMRGLLQNIILLPGNDMGILNSLGEAGFFLLAIGAILVAAGLVAILYLSLRGDDLRQQQ